MDLKQHDAQWRRDRLAANWVYQGAEATRVAGLSPGQVGYALTLRRQLADRLRDVASRRAVFDPTPRGREWSRIAHACRREVARTERVMRRLGEHGGAP